MFQIIKDNEIIGITFNFEYYAVEFIKNLKKMYPTSKFYIQQSLLL